MEAEGWQQQLQDAAALPQDVDMTDVQLLVPADGTGADDDPPEGGRDAALQGTAAPARELRGRERNVSRLAQAAAEGPYSSVL